MDICWTLMNNGVVHAVPFHESCKLIGKDHVEQT
jgi:hypothetical protein